MSATIQCANKDSAEGTEVELLQNAKKSSKTSKHDDEVNHLLSESGIGALAQCAAATTKKFKVFWVVLFFCALIGFSSNLYHIIERFLRVPVLTQMNQEYGEFIWPHITICNPSNPIQFWESPELVRKWDELLNKSSGFPRMLYRGAKDVTIFSQYLLMSSINPSVFYKDRGSRIFLSVSVLFDQSTIATSSADFDRFKSIRNLTSALEERLGSLRYPHPCQTLKPEAIAKMVNKKPSEILKIKITLIDDYRSYQIFNSGFENRKAYLYFTNPNETLNGGTLYYLSPGTDTKFIATERRYTRIRGCGKMRSKVKMYDPSMTKTKTYKGGFQTCHEYISQLTFVQRCNCYNPFLPIYKVSDRPPSLCLNISLFSKEEVQRNLNCLNEVNKKFSDGEKFKKILMENCEQYQKPLCHQTFYKYLRHTNIWKLNMSKQRRALMENAIAHLPNAPKTKNGSSPSLDFANLNLITLYFSRSPGLVTATLEEWEYPTSQLLSDVGGTMGLWLGISVISLFEILQFIILMTVLLGKRRQKDRRN